MPLLTIEQLKAIEIEKNINKEVKFISLDKPRKKDDQNEKASHSERLFRRN